METFFEILAIIFIAIAVGIVIDLVKSINHNIYEEMEDK